TNSFGVFGPAGTVFPSTTTKPDPPLPTKLSSTFVGTYFALNISVRVNPTLLHNSDGNRPETAQMLRLTIPSGRFRRSCRAINSGLIAVAALANSAQNFKFL